MSTSKAFELLHMDLFGPTTYTSIGAINMDLSLLMISQDILGYSFLVTRVMHIQPSNPLSKDVAMNLKQLSRELEVTMEVNSRTQELMNCMMNMASNINFRPSIHLNPMGSLKGRI
jgi:hypothetical protein